MTWLENEPWPLRGPWFSPTTAQSWAAPIHLRGANPPGWVPGAGRKELSQNEQEKEKNEVTFDFSEENIAKAKASFKKPYAGARGPFYTGDRKDWRFGNDNIENYFAMLSGRAILMHRGRLGG